jgi:hypothetical protein
MRRNEFGPGFTCEIAMYDTHEIINPQSRNAVTASSNRRSALRQCLQRRRQILLWRAIAQRTGALLFGNAA